MTKNSFKIFYIYGELKFALIPLIIFFAFGFVSAQSEWNDIIAKENGLVVQQAQEVEISVTEDGNLEIISKIYEETQHFGENANMYSEQSIGYSNTFTEVLI